MDRRRALKLLGLAPIITALDCTWQDVDRAAAGVDALSASLPYSPQFFTEHEWRTVHVLADLVIPRDDRSGSATDARTPEFMDFMLNEGSETRRTGMREGLAWLDGESSRRFGVAFADATDAQQRALLDDIAWPDRAPAELQQGVTFFNTFRDMTAAGFFSSRIGYEDLQYMGRPKSQWTGCPAPALHKLGVSPDIMERRT